MREQSCHEVRTLYYPLPFLLHLSLYLTQLSACAPYQSFIHMAFLSLCVIVNPADRYSGTFRMSVHFSRVHGVTFQEKASLRSEKWNVCSTTLTFRKTVVSIRDDWYMSSACPQITRELFWDPTRARSMRGSFQCDGCENLNCHLFPVHQNHLTFWNDSGWVGGYLVSSILSYPRPALWGCIKYIGGQLVEASWNVPREQTIWNSCLTFRRNLVRQFALSLATTIIKQPDKVLVHKLCTWNVKAAWAHYFLINQVIISKFYLLFISVLTISLKLTFF